MAAAIMYALHSRQPYMFYVRICLSRREKKVHEATREKETYEHNGNAVWREYLMNNAKL